MTIPISPTGQTWKISLPNHGVIQNNYPVVNIQPCHSRDSQKKIIIDTGEKVPPISASAA